jgi:hypothetical protein
MKKAPTTTAVDLTETRQLTATDVIDRVLDKGIVIDCRVNRVSLSGIDLPVTVDACFVIASLDTYLQYLDPLSKAGLLRGTDAWLQDLTNP